MKPEQQNEALAKFMGWRPFTPSCAIMDIRECDEPAEDAPDYLNSLDAVHSLERRLLGGGDDWGLYCDNLMDVVVRNGGYQAAELYVHASAAQRCEAILRTLDLWVEEPTDSP